MTTTSNMAVTLSIPQKDIHCREASLWLREVENRYDRFCKKNKMKPRKTGTEDMEQKLYCFWFANAELRKEFASLVPSGSF